MKIQFSRKRATRAILATALALAMAAPVPMSSIAFAASTTQTETTDTETTQPSDTQAQPPQGQPPQGGPDGQPPMGPPPDGERPSGPPPDGSTPPGPPPDGQMGQPPQGAPNGAQGQDGQQGQPPQGQPPQGGPGQQSTKSASEFEATRIVDAETETIDSGTFDATATDANAVLVRNGGTLTLTGATLSKTGDSSSADASNFSGQNAVFLAADSTALLENLTLTSDADGANAVFATGANAKATAKHLTIHTKNNSSRGLDATYDGTIVAQDVDITTEGEHCAALATDRGEGTVTVTGAKIATSGAGSPNVYSTGAITLRQATGTATGSEIAVVEGKNSITLENVDLTGTKDHGVMLYQSFSGDAGVGEASFTAKDSTLRNDSDGPMFFVTNTQAVASLQNVALVQSGDTLVNVAAGRWGRTGANGGDFTLTAKDQMLTGAVKADEISSITLNLDEGAAYTGAFNSDDTAKSAAITLAKSATWTLTDDAYVTTLADAATGYTNITSNGHNIYYNADAADDLGGRTYALPGGGKLMPKG